MGRFVTPKTHPRTQNLIHCVIVYTLVCCKGTLHSLGLVPFPESNLGFVFEDHRLWVLHKPAGMLSQKTIAEPEEDVTTLLKWHLGDPMAYVGLVHRLDRNVSGLLLVAKTPAAAKKLSEGIRTKKIRRTYEAVVKGTWDKLTTTFEISLLRKEMKSRADDKGTLAITHVTLMKHLSGVLGKMSVLEVRLETGLTHQIRAHLSTLGHPIFNDIKYGGARVHGLGQLMLHAKHIHIPKGVLDQDEWSFTASAPWSHLDLRTLRRK